MEFQQNVSLAGYSTMGLGGPAAYLVEVHSRQDVSAALNWAKTSGMPAVMIGGGSNIIWGDRGYPGLVMVDRIMGFEVFDEDETNTYLTIGSGESWDAVVERSVAAGLTGIEALSLIPGSAGATPVQNVGAYGQEIADTLVTVTAYDTAVNDFVTLRGEDCGFGYRTSRFKTTDHGRFFITSLTLHLTKGNLAPPFYSAVEKYFEEHGSTEYTPAAIREAVIAIRTAKLPDPAVVRNAGSFFANPIVTDEQLIGLRNQFDPLPSWPVDSGGAKLSAAWLIEQAGFKDYYDKATGIGTWAKQPLVLVNHQAKTTADLMTFKQKIIDAVQAKFGVMLVQEPELMS